MIHSKINKPSNENAWYTRKSTNKVMKTLDTFENQQKKWWKRLIHSKFWSAPLQILMGFWRSHDESVIGLQGHRWNFRMYDAFASLCLLIFECIMCFYYFFCWFSSVSCVFITFFVDFRVYHAFPLLFVGRIKKVMEKHDTLENQQTKW